MKQFFSVAAVLFLTLTVHAETLGEGQILINYCGPNEEIQTRRIIREVCLAAVQGLENVTLLAIKGPGADDKTVIKEFIPVVARNKKDTDEKDLLIEELILGTEKIKPQEGGRRSYVYQKAVLRTQHLADHEAKLPLSIQGSDLLGRKFNVKKLEGEDATE